jgi:hypothetical protein
MAKSLHDCPFMLARAKLVFAVFVCVFSTSHSIWALETPAPQSNLLNIQEDCVETNSVSPQGPSNQLLQYVDVLKNVMKTKHDSGSLIFDGKESLCSIYSEDCQDPIEETFVKPPEALEDVKMVLVNTKDASGDAQPETVARALDENANLVQINSETNEQKTIQFSEGIKEILSQAQGQFDPSGKTYKLSGLTEEQKEQLREELQQTAIEENSQTGELSLNLDQVFESASKQSLNQTQVKISSGVSAFPSPATHFGSLNSAKEEVGEKIREEICKRVEKMHPETSAFYQDCVQRGLIDSAKSTRNEKASWSANILKATRSELNRSSSTSKQWPSTFPYVYPRPATNTLQNAELNSTMMNPLSASTGSSMNPSQGGEIASSSSARAFKISDASESQGQAESADRAEQAIEDMVAALMDTPPNVGTKKADATDSEFQRAGTLNQLLKDSSLLSSRNKVLVAEALSLRNMVRDFKESKLGHEINSFESNADIVSALLEGTDFQHFGNHTAQDSAWDSNAQPTSGQQKGAQSPAKSSEIEIPPFVLPERRRYAPETDSDEPPHS